MQTKLAILRSQLTRLRRMRSAVRWGSALCATAGVMLWLLLVAFVSDWSLNLPPQVRWVMLPGWIACSIIAIRKLAWPVVAMRETIEDVALIVERHHDIDSDLVAAIQFEEPRATSWGSPTLEQAVVAGVAAASPSINVFDGFSYQPLPKRAMVLGMTVIFAIGFVMALPGHSAAFGNRFLLGSADYPTRTWIESIVVSGQQIPLTSEMTVPRIRVPYGQSIPVAVRCGGQLPASGFARLSSLNNDSANRVNLMPMSINPDTFTGELIHVADSFRVSIHLGDAVSRMVEIVVVPLPLVDIAWDIVPPEYAAASLRRSDAEKNSHQLSGLEGSTAGLKLVCSNKRLTSARLTSNQTVFDLLPSGLDQPTVTWSLPAGTPFEKLREALKYEIQVVDEDGLSLERPIVGQIRLKTDKPPRIVALAVTQQVLPTAAPKLDYAATDDFGLAKIVAIIQISREDGRTARHEIVVKVIPETEQPVTSVRGQVAIPLSQYELVKGDEVKVVLEATDWRGDVVGQQGMSEPNTLSVTDLNGILTQTGEEDKKTAKQLDEILRRELTIGVEKK